MSLCIVNFLFLCLQFVNRCVAAHQNSTTAPGRYDIELFRLVHASTHEMFHLFITMLGNGRRTTPAVMSGGRWTRSVLPYGEGEAGEFGEKIIFGGLVEFIVDNRELGQVRVNTSDHIQLTDTIQYGFPWIVQAQGQAVRVDFNSIRALLQPRWEGTAEATIISGSTVTSSATSIFGHRPRVVAGQRNSTLQAASSRPSQR